MKRITVFLTIICSLAISQACGQKQKVSQVSSLTGSLLQRATSIVFSTDNGTVPPEYQYSCKVTVKKGSVRMTVKTEYGEKTPYDKTARLTDAQYRRFLNSLGGQSIRKSMAVEDPGHGGSQAILVVYQNSSVLFKGEDGVDLIVGRGTLADSFREVLPSDMRAILDNPERAKINNIFKKIKKK